MSEKRFHITDTGLGLDTESDEMYDFGDEEDFCRLFDKLNEQQAIIDMQELRLQRLEELLELSENLNKSYREKLIDMNLKMVIDNE